MQVVHLSLRVTIYEAANTDVIFVESKCRVLFNIESCLHFVGWSCVEETKTEERI